MIDQQVQQAINAATASMTSAMSQAMRDFAMRLGKISATHADDMSKSLKRSSGSVSTSLDSFGESVQDAADVIRKSGLGTAFDRMNTDLRRRLENESTFVNQSKVLHGETLRQRALDLQANKEAALKALLQLKKQTEQIEKDTAERDKAIKDRQRIDKAAKEAKQRIDDATARIDARTQRQKTLEAQLSAANTRAARAAIQQQIDTDKSENEADNRVIKRKSRLVDRYNKLDQRVGKLSDRISAHNTTVADVNKKLKDTSDALEKTVEAIDRNRPGEAIQRWKKGIEDGIKNKLFSTALIGVGLKNIANEVRTGINRGVGMLDITEQGQVSQLGMSPAEFMEATGEYRSAMIAAGGMGKSLELLGASVDNLSGDVASRAESAKFAMQQMQMFTTMGIAPTTDRVKRMGSMFKELHQKTGMTLDQFNTSMRDIMENEDTLQSLRLANTESEREAIQTSIAARYKENRLRGISDEQTRAMIKKQQEQANQRPLTRFQQAVKHAAMGSAMGVAGSSELIQLSMIPENRKTDAQRAREQQLRGNIDQAVQRGMGGSFGQQLATDQLSDKLGWDKSMAVYNTKLAEAVEKGMDKGAAKTFGEVADSLKRMNDLYERGMGIAQNSWVQIAAGLAGVILAMGPNTIATFANTTALKANTLVRGGPGGMMDTLNRRGGKVLQYGKKALPGVVKGGAGMLAGMGLDWAADAAHENGHNKTAGALDVLSTTASGAGIGMTAGSFLGPYGAAVGGALGGTAGLIYGLMKSSREPKTAGTESTAAQIKPAEEQQKETKRIVSQVERTFSEMEIMQSGDQDMIEKYQNRRKELYQENIAKYGDNARGRNVARIHTQQELAKEFGKDVGVTQPPASIKTVIPAIQSVNADQRIDPRGDNTTMSKREQQKQQDEIAVAERQWRATNQSNEFLKVVAENVPTLVELANKQLIAMTLTETEKGKNRDKVRKGSNFSSSNYEYVS